jgi:hypothetical protein
MKKALKIAIISLAALAAAAVVLFVVIPLAVSKEAEARLGKALAEAGIPDDVWSVGRVYYSPLIGHLVLEKLEFGERGSVFLGAKKITLALDMNKKDLFEGSVNAQELSFFLESDSITIKDISANDFSVDRSLLGSSPVEAVKKLGNVHLTEAVFSQGGAPYFSLGKFDVDMGYAEGKIPFPASVSLKDFVMDARPFAPLSTLWPEYRLSKLELKNSLSGGVYMITLDIDDAKLFTIKANLGISFPPGLLESGEIRNLALIDYDDDVKLDSFAITYTDKSFLDHVFELAGMSGGRESFIDELNGNLAMIAMAGGVDVERFAGEMAKFIEKPGKFELKIDLDSPMSLDDISSDPFAMNASLSLNGGKPFTMARPMASR